jgi:hypothetical protein
MTFTGKVCAAHPELGGRRHNGGNCPECLKASKAAHRQKNREKLLQNMREYRLANKARIAAMNAAWTANNKDRVRFNNLKRLGFTPELFEQCVVEQGGACAICRVPLADLPTKQVHADHCHATNQARGVLCHYCNAGLGSFRDDPERLRAALAYLETPTLVKCLL